MAVSAIQNNENNSKNSHFLKSATIGALTGYSLKYLIPITPQEKDEFYNSAVDDIETKAQKAKFNAIKKLSSKNNTAIGSNDSFARMCNSSNLTQAELEKKLKLPEETIDLIHQVNNISKRVSEQGMASLKATIKSIRPTFAFVITGVAIGLGTALTRSISNRIVEEKTKAIKDKAEEKTKTEKETKE